jgi:hypothetical protein
MCRKLTYNIWSVQVEICILFNIEFEVLVKTKIEKENTIGGKKIRKKKINLLSLSHTCEIIRVYKTAAQKINRSVAFL